MQVLQDNFFYHSKSRLGSDGDLNNEKLMLVEEQKLCRARARRFSLETNQRRRALDERRKQWDMQEQRLRENILQQRRQQVQDATERFQRAHLPPSQRYRQTFRRNAVNIEDALRQLQGTLSSCTVQPAFLSSNPIISRSCTASPKPPTVSKSDNRKALSAVDAYTKLLQEQSRTERYQDQSPQESHLSDCCNSESLSSKDSLENEEPNQKNPQCSYSSFFLDCERAHPDLKKETDLCPTSHLTSVSATMLPGENAAKSRIPPGPKEEKQEDSEWPSNIMHASKSSWEFISAEETPKTDSHPAVHNCNSLAPCEVTTGDPGYFRVTCLQDNPSDNISVTDQNILGNMTEMSNPKQEAVLDLKQQRPLDDSQINYPSSTDIPFPPKKDSSKNIWFGASLKPNMLEDGAANNLSNYTFHQIGEENQNLPSKKELFVSINNLNKVSDSELKTTKPLNAASQPHASLSSVQADTLKCLNFPDEEHKFPISVATCPSVCEVKIIKGILKKPSKHLSRDFTCLYGSEHLIFSKQLALAIRDSVELTRTKAMDMEVSKTIKKKLRWFDEVHKDKDAEEQNIIKQIKGKSSSPYHPQNNSGDHQLSFATDLASPHPGHNMSPATSTGYHFTKEAWTDVGVQVNLPQEQADEVKVPQSSTRTCVPKVPRRERPSRVGAGPFSTRTRKGTVIRPQSATEVSQIAKTQGKIMVPRPPPRMESVEEMTPYITESPYGVDRINYKQALVMEKTLHKKNSEGFFSPNTHPVITTDTTVMYKTHPHSYTCPLPEANMKSMPISSHQETQNNRRRETVQSEKGLCLECTPTDEEISQLWHGVRSALNTKDAKIMGKRQVPECRRVLRKPCTEHSRQPPGSEGGKLLQTSQVTKQTTELGRTCSGFESTAQLHLAEMHAVGSLEEKHVVAAMDTTQTHRAGTMRQHNQQQGLTTTSSEEKKILLSLERLNHQLHCLQEHMVGNTSTCGLAVIDTHFRREVKVANSYMNRASSADCHRYQRKF